MGRDGGDIPNGGGMSCDGVEVETSENKHFGFSIRYIKRRRRHLQIGHK